ncbi:MAG: 50S ribosomal protein L5 [Omnitrophica bacterium GWA2_52_8]|nr:MAG: 50S ribosomal protein L5 [Omnitrophica bacterium GWA2_52_8]
MKAATSNVPRLLELYRNEVAPQLIETFKYKNVMQVPKVTKVSVNVGLKEAKDDAKILEQIVIEIGMITGQKPVITKAKKSIANFKSREGYPVGVKVTLRGKRMYEFLDRLFNIAMPRIRDFRGFSDQSFDDRGNYSLGIQEQSIFPEVEFDKIKLMKGMDVTIVTSAVNREEGKRLLELLGLPFRKKQALAPERQLSE